MTGKSMTTDVSETEIHAYKVAAEDGTSEALVAFLTEYPKSIFRDVVLVQLSQLKAGLSVSDLDKPKRSRKGVIFAVVFSSLLIGLLGGAGGMMLYTASSISVPKNLPARAGPISSDMDPTGEVLTTSKAELIASTAAFEGDSFPDSAAERAIRAASSLESSEIEDDEEMIDALETIMDSFFAADRFDLVARVETKHSALFKRRAEFYVSFCLSYGLRIIETSNVPGGDLWSVEDQVSFDENVKKYREYASLDVVEQRFPEYEYMFDPFIMKLEGANDAALIAKMRGVSRLEGADLQNFMRNMERYATGGYTRATNRPSVVRVGQRVASLISTYGTDDPSGTWSRVGLLANIDP